MRTEKLDPRTRSEGGPPEERATQERRDARVRKQRAFKDDGRYIIFYDFEPGEGGKD